MKHILILMLACLITQIAMAEPSLAEKNAAENAAIKKEWESWNAPFWTAVASEARHRFRTHWTGSNFHTPRPPKSAGAAGALPARSMKW